MEEAGSGVDWLAVVGAFSGLVALGWNVLRYLREGPKVRASFFALPVELGQHTELEAHIALRNPGTVAAYIYEVRLVERLSWPWHNWFRRLAPYGSFRRRFVLHTMFLGASPQLRPWTPQLSEELVGKLEPGEMATAQVQVTSTEVESLLKREAWLVVRTGTDEQVARLRDQREVRLRPHPEDT